MEEKEEEIEIKESMNEAGNKSLWSRCNKYLIAQESEPTQITDAIQ